MKKWFQFFSLSFFSDKTSKDAMSRGYTNLFLGLVLAFALLWAGVVGGEMLPFGTHYAKAPDFVKTVHNVLANPDPTHRVEIAIQDGVLQAKKQGIDMGSAPLVSTLTSTRDAETYAVYGYEVVVDTRPADTLAEVEIYYLSNDGENLKITYEEYLSLSAVARRNFDFHMRYTGRALNLDEALVATCKQYLLALNDEMAQEVARLEDAFAGNTITRNERDRSLYELYFTNYYPDITTYEGTSKVPLLRNYYYHEYIESDKCKYLFIFDDCLAASFETTGEIRYAFYGLFSEMEDGALLRENYEASAACQAADAFIKAAFASMAPITCYAHAMNIFTFIPFIALMPLVVALLAYSLLKLRGVDSIQNFGSVAKIIGSYIWFSAVVAALLTVAVSFFVQPGVLTTLSMILFFVTLAVRSIIFAIDETRAYIQQLSQNEAQTED